MHLTNQHQYKNRYYDVRLDKSQQRRVGYFSSITKQLNRRNGLPSQGL
jgi:hypothetical protein